MVPTAAILPVAGAAEHSTLNLQPDPADDESKHAHPSKTLNSTPLGLAPGAPAGTVANDLPSAATATAQTDDEPADMPAGAREGDLPEPYKATRLPLIDRLAARDRAYALLSGLTRLGTGWNHSDAWFTLARAYEESGQPDKAKEVLWWCVELEEARGVRGWSCLGGGGYVL